jgi:hypothetical protein
VVPPVVPAFQCGVSPQCGGLFGDCIPGPCFE